jgi:23S rRNA (uridine2552-2'-O)-methyltransferase
MANYTKPDFWALKAQKEGYPARSVYKLKGLDERFGLFKARDNGQIRVLDLGAAPGSWSLYVLRRFGKRVSLTAADISPLSPAYQLFTKACFVQGDITAPETRDAILSHSPFDLVMSDAAPATTGHCSVDTLRSLVLAETALEYAEAGLVKGGNLVVKVFQGGDTATLLKRIRELFETGKGFKPEACRRESFETYYVGLCKH